MTHTIFLCFNCNKQYCYDCSIRASQCCLGFVISYIKDGGCGLNYNKCKLDKIIKIQKWYKRVYFKKITIPKLWNIFEELMKIKYHPDNIMNIYNDF